MKMKFSRWVSMLLVLALLVSFGAVFASAEETGDEEEKEEAAITLYYKRTYDEGWDYSNGGSAAAKDNNYFIDYEVDATYQYNYFWRMEALNNADGYLQINLRNDKKNATVFSFDAKSDDYPNIGQMYYQDSASVSTTMFAIKSGSAYLMGYEMGPVDDNWRHYCVILDWTTMKATLSVEGDGLTEGGMSVTKLERTVDIKHAAGINYVRIGVAASANNPGLSWCLDNLAIFQGPARDLTDEERETLGYGDLVNKDASKTETIVGGTVSGLSDYLDNSLCMKVGVNYARLRKQKVAIYEDGKYGAPLKIDGTIYIPLDLLLEYIGYPYYVHPDGLSYDISTGTGGTYLSVGRTGASVNGKSVELNAAPSYIVQTVDGEEKSYLAIALDDVELLFASEDAPESSFYVTYDEMGLIIICGMDNVVNRIDDLEMMMTLMKDFIFDYPSGEQFYEDVKKTTNNFTHPYILANQDKFDDLIAIYNAKTPTDPNYNNASRKPLVNLINSYTRDLNNCIIVDDDGNYVGLKESILEYLVNPNDVLGNFGYDPYGGRLNESEGRMGRVANWGFAYQLTKNINFAYAIYDYIYAMGQWDHWGPAHFLNCAGATWPAALAFDWAYDGLLEVERQDPTRTAKTIADIIYSHGVYQAYNSVVRNICEWPNSITGSYRYDNFTNNWNAVCTSGIVIGALAILQYDGYKSETLQVVEKSLFALGDHGLGQYAPDGSYIESPGYWSYGTNTFFRLCAALESAAGTDYGFMDCWGIDTTCYFAIHAESSDYNNWNFHDGGEGSQDGSFFLYTGAHFGDENLCALRFKQLNNGKSWTVYDIMFYDEATAAGEPQAELAYYMQGSVQAYTIRSSWEKKAIFSGIMGGEGNVAHGNIDNGNFIYDNLGTRWIKDLGGDEYNVYNYFSANWRYRYYRLGAEGSNVLVLTSEQDTLPYGQELNANTYIQEHYENEYGGYAILDTSPAYTTFVTTATRGILMTNDRTTVVIQDEVLFKKVEEVWWFAHTLVSLNPEISADGQSAYLTKYVNGVKQVIRLSLVTKLRGLKFEEMSVYDYVLDTTFRTADNETELVYNKSPEYDRSQYTKFAIHGESVLKFNIAVVIEEVDKVNSTMPVKYDWTDMKDWEPVASYDDGTSDDVGDDTVTDDTNPIDPNQSYSKVDMLDAMDTFYELDEEGKIFTDKITEGYVALYTVYRVLENNPTMSNDRYKEAYNRYLLYKEKYDLHMQDVNEVQQSIRNIGYRMIGISE